MGAFFEPVNEGAIWVQPEGAQLTAMGQVFRLLKAHQGRHLIPVAATDAGGDVDAIASRGDAAGDVLVSLVNRSPGQSQTVELSFPAAVRQCEGTLLSSPDFLPASVFSETPLDARVGNGAGVPITLPPHSVALVRVAL
jgi:hypothetical protein